MRELALFAGGGGGILGGHLLGWRTVCAVEIDPYCRRVLLARQRDGLLPRFPIWDDVRTFDGEPWRGHVDVVSGGFPCQDISVAGKGAGIDGERSGLWGEFARVLREVRPRYAFVENSPALTGRGLGRVLGDLAAMGFDAEWGVLGADDAGAPHLRKRIWILAEHRGGRRLSTWPTPTVIDATMAAKGRADTKGRHALCLSHCANRGYGPDGQSMFPTPLAAESKGRHQSKRAIEMGFKPTLAEMAHKNLWPTPCACENDQGRAADGMVDGESSWKAQGRGATLTTAVKRFPTSQSYSHSPGVSEPGLTPLDIAVRPEMTKHAERAVERRKKTRGGQSRLRHPETPARAAHGTLPHRRHTRGSP